jgi:hypothetical protein
MASTRARYIMVRWQLRQIQTSEHLRRAVLRADEPFLNGGQGTAGTCRRNGAGDEVKSLRPAAQLRVR